MPFYINSGKYIQLYFHSTFAKQNCIYYLSQLLSLGPKPNQKVLDSGKYCAEVMLLCAPLSLKKALQHIYPRDLFLLSLCFFIPAQSHSFHHQTSSEAPRGQLAALTESCLSCWRENNAKGLSTLQNKLVYVFPRLTVRLQSPIHLCKSLD